MPEAVSRPHVRVAPSHGWVPLNLRDLWHYRGLLYFLAWRDIKVRYKQTTLGIAWAVLQPALTTLIFTLVFDRFMNINTHGLPYPILAISGVLPWSFFSNALGQSSSSVVSNSNLISKVYFPRLIAPIAGVIAAVPDMLVTFGLLLAFMIYYQMVPGIALLLLPLFLVLAFVTALGVGVWLSALTAQYRDFRYLIPFIVQFWMFASPVAYSSASVTPRWRTLYGLNPMVGVIEGFRWSMLREAQPSGMIFISSIMAVLLLISGLYYFRRVERSFADLI